jgi:hypothetical protein
MPCQKVGKIHTQTCPTAVSRFKQEYTYLVAQIAGKTEAKADKNKD